MPATARQPATAVKRSYTTGTVPRAKVRRAVQKVLADESRERRDGVAPQLHPKK
jgi:hypothetical protein